MQDDSYEAGYRAGHLQGWKDAMAKVAEGRNLGSPVTPPARLPAPAQVVRVAPPFPAVPSAKHSAPAPAWAAEPSARTVSRPAAVSTGAGPTPPEAKRRPQPHARNGQGTAGFRPVVTEAELKARRERRDRQNINVTLYVASLLLVAAAALFIGTGLPPMMKFAGVCSVAVLFYGAGFLLHHRVPRLKPAAVAFTGTGLAMVPVTGLALYSFVWANGAGAWLATSVIGTLAYIAAALRLESRVLAYLSLTFLISTAWSGMAVLGAALVWYFVVLIALASLLTLLSLGRPGWLPPLFLKPLVTLHPVVVPAVAVAATFLLNISLGQYALILGLCGLYFAAVAGVRAVPHRLPNFYAARASLTISASVAILELTDNVRDGLFAAAAMLAVQSISVAIIGPRLDTWLPGRRTESAVGAADSPSAPPQLTSSRWRPDAVATHALQGVATAAIAGISIVSAIAASWVPNTAAVPLGVPVLILLVTSFILAARIAGSAELLPFASLLLALMASRVMGEWEFALMVIGAAALWIVRALRAGGARRQVLLLNARLAATVAVPAVTAAVAEGRTQGQAIWFSLVAAAAAQQLLSSLLQRGGRPAMAPQTTLLGFSAAGTIGVAVLSELEAGPGRPLTWAAILIQLAAAAGVGLLLVRSRPEGSAWTPRMGEVLPPVVAAVMVVFAFSWVSSGGGNLALAIVVSYLAGTALRLRPRLHRWAYWWLARAAATVLTLTAFDELVNTAGAPAVSGEVLRPGTVLVAMLAVQMAVVLLSFRLGRAPGGIAADAGAVLAVQIIGCALLWPLSEGSWQHVLVPALAATSAAAAAVVLRSGRGSAWYAPAAFFALTGLSLGNPAAVEVQLGIFAALAAVMVAAAPHATAKGAYFVAARILTAALAVVLSYDISASPDVVSVTFAGVLAAQHGVRWLMRSRMKTVPFQQAAVWITLAGQTALPLAYFVQQGRSGDDAERWILLLEAGLLLASVIVARYTFLARGALYFGAFALLAAVLTLSPLVLPEPALLDYTGTALVLLSLAVAAAGTGVVLARRLRAPDGSERWLWLTTALGFTLTALLLAGVAEPWIAGSAVLVLAGVLFCAAHTEDSAALYAPATAAVLAGTFMVAAELPAAAPGVWADYVPWLSAAAAGIALYGVRTARPDTVGSDPWRRWSLAGGAFAGLILAALAGLPADATAWAAAAALGAAAGVAVVEVPPAVRRTVAEAGALVVLAGVQRAAIFDFDSVVGPAAGLPDPFWVAQWYVVLGAVIAVFRYYSGQAGAGRAVGIAAASLLTVSGAGTVFGGSTAQQLWLLVMLALVLVAGLVASDKVFVRWGAAGVAACILWAMRGYTFALLALIAVGLIAFAVWRLNRTSGVEQQAGKDTPARDVP